MNLRVLIEKGYNYNVSHIPNVQKQFVAIIIRKYQNFLVSTTVCKLQTEALENELSVYTEANPSISHREPLAKFIMNDDLVFSVNRC